MIKKKTVLILVLLLVAASTCTVPAFSDSGNAYIKAEQLNILNLLKGVSIGSYDMQRAPTRTEGIVMVVRLLGKEQEAVKYQGSKAPFYDVPAWAEKYVSYAYASGLTKGVSGRQFGSDLAVDAEQYITFLLRSLDYADDKDFTYGNSKKFAGTTGMLDGWSDGGKFLRSDMIFLSYNALNTDMKSGDTTLAGLLAQSGVFTGAQWERAKLLDSITAVPRNDYEWNSVLSITVSSKNQFLGSFGDAMAKLPDQILVNVPAWNEEVYFDYFDEVFDYLIEYARGCKASGIQGTGQIEMTPTYSKGHQSLAYLQNPTAPVSGDIKSLAMKGFDIYMREFKQHKADYELVRAIHDYIAGSLKYDHAEGPGSDDLDGALNTGKATCSGYAAAFQFFARVSGLESAVVIGTATNTAGQVENHAWNKVKVNGAWYNIDVTWDDPVTDTGADIVTYDYFLVSDDVLSKDHTWDRSFYPHSPYSWN